jgi:hypothetical protein
MILQPWPQTVRPGRGESINFAEHIWLSFFEIRAWSCLAPVRGTSLGPRFLTKALSSGFSATSGPLFRQTESTRNFSRRNMSKVDQNDKRRDDRGQFSKSLHSMKKFGVCRVMFISSPFRNQGPEATRQVTGVRQKPGQSKDAQSARFRGKTTAETRRIGRSQKGVGRGTKRAAHSALISRQMDI